MFFSNSGAANHSAWIWSNSFLSATHRFSSSISLFFSKEIRFGNTYIFYVCILYNMIGSLLVCKLLGLVQRQQSRLRADQDCLQCSPTQVSWALNVHYIPTNIQTLNVFHVGFIMQILYFESPAPTQATTNGRRWTVEKLICMPEYLHVRSENQRVLNWYSSHNIHTLSWNDTKLCFFGHYILRFHSCFYFSPTQTNQSIFLPLNSTHAYYTLNAIFSTFQSYYFTFHQNFHVSFD